MPMNPQPEKTTEQLRAEADVLARNLAIMEWCMIGLIIVVSTLVLIAEATSPAGVQ